MTTAKPREWFLHIENNHRVLDGDWCGVTGCDISKDNIWDANFVHVIEKSAYDELEEKYQLLLDDRLNQKTIKALMDGALRYKAQADKLSKTLEIYAKLDGYSGPAANALTRYRDGSGS